MPTATMSNEQICWWIFVFLVVIIALIALAFALLAYSDSQFDQSHRNICRRDGRFCGDVIIDSELRVEGTAYFDDNVYISGTTTTKKLVTQGVTFSGLQIINSTGMYSLNPAISNYRVDTPGTNTITLVLPLVSLAPGAMFWVSTSRAGQGNTVNLNLSSGDMLCSGTSPSTITNPAYTMPILSGTPDQIMLTNDSVNVWFVSGHA
jgi:magnesium-transporting ATPase (P-type)